MAPNAAPRPSVLAGPTTPANRAHSTRPFLELGTYIAGYFNFFPYRVNANVKNCEAPTSPLSARRKSSLAPASPHPRKHARPSSILAVDSATSSLSRPTKPRPLHPTLRITSHHTVRLNITTLRLCEATLTCPQTAQTTLLQSTAVSA